jgi:hypothetical protein
LGNVVEDKWPIVFDPTIDGKRTIRGANAVRSVSGYTPVASDQLQAAVRTDDDRPFGRGSRLEQRIPQLAAFQRGSCEDRSFEVTLMMVRGREHPPRARVAARDRKLFKV